MEEVDGKRILLIGPAYPFRGGIAHFLESTRRALADRGHSVQVVLFPGNIQIFYSQEKHSTRKRQRVQ